MHKFVFLAEIFVRMGGAGNVESWSQLVEAFLFRDGKALKAMGRRAYRPLASIQRGDG
jgi:hypothetical protein